MDEKKVVRFVRYEWRKWNFYMFIIILLLTVEAIITGSLEKLLSSLGNYGYLGGILAGFFFTFGATTPFSIATFFILAEHLNPWLLTLLGALSGLISEYIIFDFVKNETGKTIMIYKNKKIKLPKIKSKFLLKLSPLIAGIIIATPIPDEFVAVIFGIEKYNVKKFLVLTFVAKFIGILFIIELGRIL
jgi:membrane protein YqaA with SNARE-associated domain